MSEQQQWHLIDGNGQQCGPYTWEQLGGFAGDGTISPATQLWRVGTEVWVSASEVEELFPRQPGRPRLLTGAAAPPASPPGTTGPPSGPPKTAAQVPRSSSRQKIWIAVGVAVPLLLVVLFLAFNENTDPQNATETESEKMQSPEPDRLPSDEEEKMEEVAKIWREFWDNPVAGGGFLSSAEDLSDEQKARLERGLHAQKLLMELAGNDDDQKNAIIARIASRQEPQLRAKLEDDLVTNMQYGGCNELRQISFALQGYAHEYDRKFPDTLDLVKEGGENSVHVEQPDGSAPEVRRDRWKQYYDSWGLPYLYLGKGLSFSSPLETPLMAQNPAGQEKIAVVYVDGSAKLVAVKKDGTVFEKPFEDLNAILLAARDEKPVSLVTESLRSQELPKRRSSSRLAGDSPSKPLAEASRKSEDEKSTVERIVPIDAEWLKILGEAIDDDKLEERGPEGKELWHVSGSEEPYTGWSKTMHENGQPKLVFRYEGGILDGPHIVWHAKGGKATELTFKGGSVDGPVYEWHSNGKKSSVGSFNAGKQVGPVTRWHENGQKKASVEFRDGKQEGPYMEWHKNGRKAEESIFKGGKLHGLATAWHDNGTKSLVGAFHEGAKEGLWTEWHENGQKSEEGHYKDGAGTGPWTFWHENGQESAKGAYKEGQPDGLWTDRYENGQKEEEGRYLAGERDGPWIFWHENGQKKNEGGYNKGRRDGAWTRWHIYGGIASERTYKDPFIPEQATAAEKAGIAAIEALSKWGNPISYDPGFSVNLRTREVTDETLTHLGNLPKLEELILEGESFTDEGLVHLKSLTRLHSLDLEAAESITDAGLLPLRELPNLEALTLDDTKITDDGLRLLTEFPKLSRLGLWRSKITDDGLVHLKEIPHLRSLYFFTNDQITDDGLKHVRACGQLESLQLEGWGFGKDFSNAGLAHLAGMEELKRLSLRGTLLNNTGLKLLQSFPKLEFVEIRQDTVTDSGLVHLEGLTALKALALRSDRVTDDGISHLKKLSGLRWLNISGTKISEAGMKELQAALPKCLIEN